MFYQMESFELKDNAEHQKGSTASQPSLGTSVDLDVICDDSLVCARIGSEYQVDIPNLATEEERRQLMTSPLDSCKFLGYEYCVEIGLDIPVTWASHPPTEVSRKEEKLGRWCTSETEFKDNNRGIESHVTPIYPTSNNAAECDFHNQDAYPLPPTDEVGSSWIWKYFTFDKSTTRQLEPENSTPLPGLSACSWSDAETKCFLLGLYIFGRNLALVSKLVESKTVGDVLSYYYGRFYRTDAYQRWSECRKMKARKCILGRRIFIGSRQQELISRLKSAVPKEAHNLLLKAFKSLNDDQTSFEEFVFALKSIVGMEAFVQSVGIGKGEHDLTGVALVPARRNQVVSAHPEVAAVKSFSSLALEEIIKFLTGDSRLSKTRSSDLFWGAVWPRLLARGWHSEQPKDVPTTKNSLVFLMPGIKKFSRRNLTKGIHYFDFVSDVLKKVAADPALLELEVDGMDNGVTDNKIAWVTDTEPNQNVIPDHQKQSYLHRTVPNIDHGFLKYMIIDTSLVDGEGSFKVRELRSLPADANISFGPSHHLNTISGSSSEEQGSYYRSSDEQEETDGDKNIEIVQEQPEQTTADGKDVEVAPVYKTSTEIQMTALLGTSRSVAPVNCYASDEQPTCNSSVKGNETDLMCFFDIGDKTKKHEYLSLVSKGRRFAGCNNNQTSSRRFSFLQGDGLKEVTKLLSSTSEPIDVDAGSIFRTKTLVSCSARDRPCEDKNTAKCSAKERRSKEERNIASSRNQERPLEQKVTAVDGVPYPNVAAAFARKVVKEGSRTGRVIDLNKPYVPADDEMNTDEVSDDELVPNVPSATRNPVRLELDQPSQMNPRRQGTRYRPPTARALEAVAFGLIGCTKRKRDLKDSTSRSSRQARKSAR